MGLWDITSRDAVLEALREHDRLGRDAFLHKHGFRPAHSYVLSHEGRDYVELGRAAAVLKTRLEATSEGTQALLRPNGHVITVTRNWSRILVDGTPVALDAPVRVRDGVWLVPENC